MDFMEIADSDGAIQYEFKSGGDAFIYSFSLMSVKQALAAETLFKMHSKLFSVLPSSPSELDIAVERNLKARAYGALLIKKKEGGDLERFSPATHGGYEALGEIKCEDYGKLEKCREDFFFNMRIVSEESTVQSGDIIRLLSSMEKDTLEILLKTAAERSALMKSD